MATYDKFQGFVGYLGKKVIDCDTDLLEVYLTNDAPSASLDDVKADLAGITEQNGYLEADILNTFSETGGVGDCIAVDKTWTASGGNFGPFRYAVIFDQDVSTPVVDPLVVSFDYLSSISVLNGESFTVNFGSSLFTLT